MRPPENVIVQPTVETLCGSLIMFGGADGMKQQTPTCPHCLEILGMIEPRKRVA